MENKEMNAVGISCGADDQLSNSNKHTPIYRR